MCCLGFLLCIFSSHFLLLYLRHCRFVTAEVVAGSAAWLGRGLSCVCAQRRESDLRPSFDLTPAQVHLIAFWRVKLVSCYTCSKK